VAAKIPQSVIRRFCNVSAWTSIRGVDIYSPAQLLLTGESTHNHGGNSIAGNRHGVTEGKTQTINI
jgi:hypothetical protein